MKHSIFGGSSCYRWIRCTESLRESAPRKESGGSAARMGTALHETLSHCFRTNVDPTPAMTKSFMAVIADDTPYQDQHFEWVLDAYETARAWASDLGGQVMSERTVHMKDKRVYGTADFTVKGKGVLGVFDFKFGNVYVDAEDNEQIGFYLLATLADAGKSVDHYAEIWGGIIQPPCGNRARHRYDPLWLTSLDKAIKGAVIEYDGGHLRFREGDHCLHCPRLAYCPRANGVIAAAREQENHGAPVPEVVTAARIADAWSGEVLESAVSILRNGGRIDGYGLNKPKSVRAWAPKAAELVAKRVAEQPGGFAALSISPTQLQKQFPDLYDELSEHIIQVTYEPKSLKEVKTKADSDDETIRLLANMR